MTPLGGVGFPLALGMSRCFLVPNNILDFIPGDIVVNQIIVNTAYSTVTPPEFKIFHNSISGSNPYKIHDFWVAGVNYLKYNPYEQ